MYCHNGAIRMILVSRNQFPLQSREQHSRSQKS